MSHTNTLRMSAIGDRTRPPCMDLFASAKAEGFGDLHFKLDAASGLKAIIAIHSTRLGPAVGGCRCLPYASTQTAIEDALRLARGMTLKAAFAGLPCGGGKAVLIRPENWRDRESYFEALGDFIESLGGRYVTAIDSGTSTRDMDSIARRTRHVLSRSKTQGGGGDPSSFTAKGVRMGIQAAVKHLLKRSSLVGIHVAIQGVGHVGYALARELSLLGARLSVADPRREHTQRCQAEFNADVVSPQAICSLPCDVFAPCALGAVINDTTINSFNTHIIAGAANNQLQEERHAQLLHQQRILYVPDYVINSGGLIYVLFNDRQERERRLRHLLARLSDLLAESLRENIPALHLATCIAEKRLIQECPERLYPR